MDERLRIISGDMGKKNEFMNQQIEKCKADGIKNVGKSDGFLLITVKDKNKGTEGQVVSTIMGKDFMTVLKQIEAWAHIFIDEQMKNLTREARTDESDTTEE